MRGFHCVFWRDSPALVCHCALHAVFRFATKYDYLGCPTSQVCLWNSSRRLKKQRRSLHLVCVTRITWHWHNISTRIMDEVTSPFKLNLYLPPYLGYSSKPWMNACPPDNWFLTREKPSCTWWHSIFTPTLTCLSISYKLLPLCLEMLSCTNAALQALLAECISKVTVC